MVIHPIKLKDVSIHAPRVGGDFSAAWVWIAMAVSIHAPRVGGDARDFATLNWPLSMV